MQKREIEEALIGLKDALTMLGSANIDADDSMLCLTHTQKFYLAKLYREKIDAILVRLRDCHLTEF